MQVVVDAASHQGVAVGVLQAKEVRTADGGQHVVVVHAEEGEVVGVVDAGLGVVHQFGVAGTFSSSLISLLKSVWAFDFSMLSL